MLNAVGKKPDFKMMFQRYIIAYDRYVAEYYAKLAQEEDDYSDMYDDDDYWADYAEYSRESYWDKFLSRHNKRSTRRGRGKTKTTSLVGEKYTKSKAKNKKYEAEKDDEHLGDGKQITFYWDINNPDSNYEIFYDVYEFDKFLSENGITAPKEAVDKIIDCDVTYCCLSPITQSTKANELIVGDTFGDLSWKFNDLYSTAYGSSCM